MANNIDTGVAARELLLLKTFKHFDEFPMSAELKKLRDDARLFVPGTGSLRPRLVLVGEAPGAQEDRAGRPFVGPSGKMLDRLIMTAGLLREEVWITNVVKYRPRDNRTPDQAEVEASLDLLRRELVLVARDQCSLIVGLGRVACSALAGEAISVVREHGSVRSLNGDWKLFVSYHPSAGLRSKDIRQAMTDDFDNLRNILRGLGE